MVYLPVTLMTMLTPFVSENCAHRTPLCSIWVKGPWRNMVTTRANYTSNQTSETERSDVFPYSTVRLSASLSAFEFLTV